MGEWMTAREAISAMEKLGYRSDAGLVIARRAYAGLIEAKAERLLWGDQSCDDAAIDKSFWWASGGAAMKADWRVGDFSTSIAAKDDPENVWSRLNRDIHVTALGVMFERSGIDALLPQEDTPEAPDDRPDVASASLEAFHELFVELNCREGKPKPGEEATWAAAKAFFPKNSVKRDRIRELRGEQPKGRPRKVAE